MDEQRRRTLRLLAGHPQPVIDGDRTVRLLNGMGEAMDEIDRLRQLLIEYGRHTEGCSGQWPEYRCTCGWREVEADFR